MRGEGFEDDLNSIAEARRGRWLADRWRLDRVLGIGGTSAVYEATHRNGRRAAIKMLHPQWALMPTVRRRFLREGYISNKIEHPAVASVLDDGETEDGEAFLVLELIEGEPLSARLSREQKLPLEEVIELAEQLLDALAEAHLQGVIHRDIKPENLMLLPDGSLKVLDFGIASVQTGETSATLLTRPGATRGTPAYMAPEQARGLPVDARTDLWAVGAVLFRALSGEPVRQAPTADAMLVQAATEPIRPLRHVCPEIPATLAAVVDRALTFEPQGRYPDADSMREALHGAEQPALTPGEATLPEGNAPPLPVLQPAAPLPDLPPPASIPQEPPRSRRSPPWSWLLLPLGAALGLVLARASSPTPVASSPLLALSTQPPAVAAPSSSLAEAASIENPSMDVPANPPASSVSSAPEPPRVGTPRRRAGPVSVASTGGAPGSVSSVSSSSAPAASGARSLADMLQRRR